MKETQPVIRRRAGLRQHSRAPCDAARLPRGRAALVRVPGGFPTVTREQAVAALEHARRRSSPVLAAGHFEIFLTADRNLSYDQDLSAFDIAIVVLVARSNSLEDLRPLMPRLLDVVPAAARRAVTLVQS